MCSRLSKLLISGSVILVLMVVAGLIVLPVGKSSSLSLISIEKSLAFVAHDPIHIDGNLDFLAHASMEEWEGNGTLESPIVISGYSFSAADQMLRIENSNLHFRFVDNQLDGLSWLWCGIAVLNSANGVIENNHVRRAAAGIHVVAVENMTIRGNDVQDSSFGGIIVEDGSRNVDVVGNIVYNNNDYGIHIGNPYGSSMSFNIRIRDNIVHDNSPSGIRLLEADNCVLSNNTVLGNILDGIVVESGMHLIQENIIEDCRMGIQVSIGNCSIIGNVVMSVECGLSIGTANNTIVGNKLCHNERSGIRFYHSTLTGPSGSENLVIDNTIGNNSKWGVEFTSLTSNNIVRNNDFLLNGNDGQAYDDGEANLFRENYWDDWTEPDGDSDGFVDRPYEINGTAENSDLTPLMVPVNSLPSWYAYTTTPTTLPTNGLPLEIGPYLIAAIIGGAVIMVSSVVVLKKK